MELEDGIFYQMSYDGTDVPIIADYPGLLPASHVSNPEIPCPREFFLFLLTRRTVLCSKGEAFGAPCCPGGISEESVPHTRQAFEEEVSVSKPADLR